MNVETLAGRAELAQTLQSLQQTLKHLITLDIISDFQNNQKDDSLDDRSI